jgi:hypothetical protein
MGLVYRLSLFKKFMENANHLSNYTIQNDLNNLPFKLIDLATQGQLIRITVYYY